MHSITHKTTKNNIPVSKTGILRLCDLLTFYTINFNIIKVNFQFHLKVDFTKQ